ncbi:dNA gyrase B subunit C-terminal domain protein [Clostridium sp. CAG:413]|jgi:DNA gyrase subunit B|nr:DNA topoisomerase [Clostridium sp.]CDC09574.1 dNA gyrase B subunit C-terminal domain protein [Clostridium sp. CAG:413]
MAKKPQYNNDSIVALKEEQRVRQKPAVIFGSDGVDGCEHAVFEIVSNSVDEAREGYGDKIIVTRFADKSVEVQDFGRGLPVDYNNTEKRYNWELVFCELYASGKYDNSSGGSYEFSLGTNGLGLCATQYASEYMEAEIHTGGFKYTLNFKKGKPDGEMVKEPYSKRDTGTRIKWRPDLEVFTDIDIPLEYFQDMLRHQSVVNAGVRFILKDQVGKGFETYEYYYEKGIEDYIAERVGNDALTGIQSWKNESECRDREDLGTYRLVTNVVVTFSNKVQFKEFYHNSSYLANGGSPEKATRAAFLSQIDSYLKQNNKYQKSDSKISFQDIEDCLAIVISSFSTQTSYENQTKKAINNKGIQDSMTAFLKHQLEIYFIENPLEAEKIGNQVLINMRSRVKAEKTRQGIKESLIQNVSNLTNRIQKFVDCRSKDTSVRELFIVEGDSALGACKQSRNSEFQAIMPVRGKILNCLKCEYDRIFKSDIITDLIKVIGCGVEVKSKPKSGKDLVSFNLDMLRWNKIIICTDADVDGFHIRTMILAMIYRLMPTLINEGKVFIAESPLYEITCGDETWFAYTEKEKADVVSQLGGKKFSIQRSKGLGENDPEMMSLTTMNPSTRRLIKIEPSMAEEMAQKFDLLLGDDLAGRKDYIAQNGHLYLDLTDVS